LQKLLHCDCGFEVRAQDEAELLAHVQEHAWQAHGMALSEEQVLLLAFRAQLGEAAWPRRLVSETADTTKHGGRARKEKS
jgi:hypothetical protein